jgi:hypothetical protein
MTKTLIREVIYIGDCGDQMNFKLGLRGSSLKHFPILLSPKYIGFCTEAESGQAIPLPLTEPTASFIPNGVAF